jgi:hypothetical protein
MVVFDGNFAVGCGPGTDYPYIHIFQCILERTDVITNEVLEPITFVLAHPTVLAKSTVCVGLFNCVDTGKGFVYTYHTCVTYGLAYDTQR